MWFLENAWLIPVIPAVAFFVILFFGKRLPMKGSEVGLLSMLSSLVLSIGLAYQWIQRVGDADGGGTHEAFRSVGRGLLPRLAEEAGHEAAAVVAPVITSWTWWQSGGQKYSIGTHIDGLSVVVLLVVAFISTLVQLYSMEYLKDDRRYTHFFAALTLFSAGMLAMVAADNLVLFLLGWEIMGLCSFLLIGHWWEDGANSRAALKAFFTVRVGDVGLLVGIAILATSSGTFSIQRINEWALSGQPSHRLLFWASIALLVAIIGKSGQFPLHTWLPDAMAGPTPVSSLLHSSTMVVAGIFLGARMYPVFWEGFSIPTSSVNPMSIIAGITIVIAALLAFVQDDIKKVLAYSTVSQLGYMLLGLSVGAWTPAVFHIFTHAFFKCCLFLGAGAISHSASHHSFDMKKDMGGLRKKMPITFATFAVSTAALAGIPFLSGFFSKDEIIDNAGHNGYKVFFVIALFGAFLTAAYMTRCVYLTFFGESRGASAGHAADDHHAPAHGDSHGDDVHAEPRDAPWRITLPLVILAALAIFSGYLNAAPFKLEKFTEWVEPSSLVSHATPAGEGAPANGESTEEVQHLRAEEAPGAEAACGRGLHPPAEEACSFPEVEHAPFKWVNTIPSIVLVFAGIISSFFVSAMLYTKKRGPLVGLTQRVAPLRAGYKLLWNKYYLDDLYEKVIVRGVAGPIAKGAVWVNQNILDGIVNGTGRTATLVGRLVYRFVDQGLIDGAVNGSGQAARGAGGSLRPIQSGKIQAYGVMLFGAAALAALALVIFVQA